MFEFKYFFLYTLYKCRLLFDAPGVVGMSTHSQGEILIAFRELKALDDDPNMVSFGTLVSGMDVLQTVRLDLKHKYKEH